MDSSFLAVPESLWVASNDLAFAVWDKYAVTTGHALVVPRRLFPTWWEATPEERQAIWALVDEVKALLDTEHRPDGYNVGFNAGEAAGQTVSHFHLHVIPRTHGDVPDPRGGLRWVIAERANYLAEAMAPPRALRLLTGENDAMRRELLRCISTPAYDRIDLVVAFIMRSGLAMVASAVEDALDRGARVRILTSDYLNVTEPEALAWFLDRSDLEGLETRVFSGGDVGFHPKAYLFASSSRAGAVAEAFVGSSNLTRSGLAHSVEWNVVTAETAPMFRAFEQLWSDKRSLPLTSAWLAEYTTRAAREAERRPLELVQEPPPEEFAPYPVQEEALRALAQTREDGFGAGLVVMATGLGKTWLAAFDVKEGSFARVLFVAHREEILRQSRDVFRLVQPRADLGLYLAAEKHSGARIVFGSIQSLVRRLDEFAPDAFDYIVIDEFHHAAARSYRRLIDHFEPRFLLGLTATPERMDGADLLALCGDNLVFQCDLVAGIRRGNLCPFRYFGIRDTVDFQPIPWRNGKFDPQALTRAVETRARAKQALDEWRDKGGARTLAFCCSKTHADFMAEFFAEHGVRTRAVHSGPTSAPRRASIDRLRSGELEVLFSVDIFNEGLDVPDIDTVLMLRPTESPVLFLQQLGRGLRTSPGKDDLVVIDFIGNHRSFLLKPRTLLSLGARSTPTTAAVLNALKKNEFALPEGCSIAYDVGLFDMFRALVRMDRKSALEDFCLTHYDEEGVRPSAAQTFRAGYNPSSVRSKEGGWFDFLQDKGLLSPDEAAALDAGRDFLRDLEVVETTKSYKLVTLRAMLHEGKLLEGIDVQRLAQVSQDLVRRDPRLIRDASSKEMPDPANAPPEAWFKYWRKWPIAAWLGELKGRPGKWFRLEDDLFRPRFDLPAECADAFTAMTAELLEYLLARYLVGKQPIDEGSYRCKVSHSSGNPIVRFDRKKNPGIPKEETPFVADGQTYLGDFVKIALNVAHRLGEKGNALHALLRGWFGPSAGHPGTNFHVILERDGDRWVLRPDTLDLGGAGETGSPVLPLFPTYRVACSAFGKPDPGLHAPTGRTVRLGDRATDIAPATHFIAQARGDSMEGGRGPIRHGDYLLLEWIRGASTADLVGRRVLVEYRDDKGREAALKILERSGQGTYQLRSAAPGQSPIEGARDMTIVATLVRRLAQREINPAASHLHKRFTRPDVPGLYDEAFNVGKWNTGHVSLDGRVVLFVTLQKSKHMSSGSHYEDHLESPDMLVWSSQSSTTRKGKKGRELLESMETGTNIEFWLRRAKRDPFTYAGWAALVKAEDERPIHITWRFLDPLPDGVYESLASG